MTTQQTYYYGTGKRKSAIARVRLYPGGSGTMVVNGKPLEEAMPWIDWQHRANQPFDRIPAAANRFNVVAKIEGGGISAWADALRHGIARALLLADPTRMHRSLPTIARMGVPGLLARPDQPVEK